MDGSKPNYNIAIIGTGALACIFGARLSQVAQVRLIGTWQTQINTLNKDGLIVHELDGNKTDFPLGAIQFPFQKDEAFQADIAIVLVKSYQTAEAAERIQTCLRPGGVVLTLQNGLGNRETLQALLPTHFVSAGITMQGANIIRPGVVAHAGNGNTIIDDHPTLNQLINRLKATDIPIQTAAETESASIEEVLWRKLIINAAINPLTALLGKPNGHLADNPTARELCQQTAREAAEVAVLEGAWPKDRLDAAGRLALEVAYLTAPNRSSMLQDVSRGGRTEIGSICGEIVRHADKHGMKAPINQTWLELIQAAEKIGGGTAGEPLYTPTELARLVV